ncbi:hypothetical protein QKG26_gp068 [Chelonid alphaherpesvirus 5]|uniref:Uncharacterized protein n=1 Tax=Chelonid alphaherpesvirus 5 TaxID=702736 RepID=V5NXE9_9ALPH|nr:hypothetical protein QKG26_gp068 [Chelonid alphaherpesvirus 5]AHA93354.1 hypothetical protein [Chelonid alphaherpesvirus 5]
MIIFVQHVNPAEHKILAGVLLATLRQPQVGKQLVVFSQVTGDQIFLICVVGKRKDDYRPGPTQAPARVRPVGDIHRIPQFHVGGVDLETFADRHQIPHFFGRDPFSHNRAHHGRGFDVQQQLPYRYVAVLKLAPGVDQAAEDRVNVLPENVVGELHLSKGGVSGRIHYPQRALECLASDPRANRRRSRSGSGSRVVDGGVNVQGRQSLIRDHEAARSQKVLYGPVARVR